MSIDKTNVYFTAQAANIPAGFVVDFRHADTGSVLDMTEAMQLEGLPDGMQLRSHPGLPGRASWTLPGVSILQVGMAMRRAGFAASAKELSNPIAVPAKPDPQAAPADTLVELAPGIYMDVSGISPRSQPEEREPYELEHMAFNVQTKHDEAWVMLGELGDDYVEEIWESLTEDPVWEQLSEILESVEDEINIYRSKFDAATTSDRLQALGLTRGPSLLLWFEPEEMEFAISTDKSSMNNSYWIFIIPKDPNAPFVDDIRENHLKEIPPYFDGNEMENTFSLKPEFPREVVIQDMIARGYTYNAEYESN